MTKIVSTTLLVLTALLSATTLVQAAGKNPGKDMTMYTFDGDKDGMPTCYKDCAKDWHAYEVMPDQKMGEGWTSVERSDGTRQWAYGGKPVYFYANDKEPGDINGDGVGGTWHQMIK